MTSSALMVSTISIFLLSESVKDSSSVQKAQVTFRDSGECAWSVRHPVLAHGGKFRKERESILTLKQSDMLGIILGERKERHGPNEHLIQMPPEPIS